MRVELVTSFSSAGAELYGRRCVESILKHWPHPLTVYVDEPMQIDGVTQRLTPDIPGWLETKRRLPETRPEAEKPTNYIWNAHKFAVKPFVWLDAAERMGDGVLVWLDGDTVTTADVPSDFIERLMSGIDMAVLGRRNMHPETGFVAFSVPASLPALGACRGYYEQGWFEPMTDGWTDCHVLRAVLQTASLTMMTEVRDLTSHAFHGHWRSSIDAFALSPLGRYVQHLKGPKRKREAATC